MKTVNLISLAELYKLNNNEKLPDAYLKYLGAGDYDIDSKPCELTPLGKLINYLSPKKIHLNNFYLGYKIPQIGKEFDFLRISENSIINIELKRKTNENDILDQLMRNEYYLKFLSKRIFLYTYAEDTNTLYTYDAEKNILKKTTPEKFIEIIGEQNKEHLYNGNLNLIFKPSDYLISPFSKTIQFMHNEYFLTQAQEEISKKIDVNIKNGCHCIFLTGDAGTGKTLLVYHLAKKFMQEKNKVAIIHCGQLNSGHNELITTFNWNIFPAKNWDNIINIAPQILIIDEIQRIPVKQYNSIINYVNSNNIITIFCGDGKQILKPNEGRVYEVLEKFYEQKLLVKYHLSKKIRTNKKLADFIKVMFDLSKKQNLNISNENIDIVYFDDLSEADKYIETQYGYSYISYTPSVYYDNKLTDQAKLNQRYIGNAHQVIGQEFDNVITLLGPHFYYANNLLKADKISNNPNSTLKMFFQQITRAINKLQIVVVNNKDVFNTLMSIFSISE